MMHNGHTRDHHGAAGMSWARPSSRVPGPDVGQWLSGLAKRARTGERFEDIAADTGRSTSDIRHAVLVWAEREAAAAQAQAPRADNEQRQARSAWAGRPARAFGRSEDRAASWLRLAGVAVGLVAAGAAAVSYEAQWRLVYRDKHELGVSYVQAAIPDLGSLVFACLGIALALHGKRAV